MSTIRINGLSAGLKPWDAVGNHRDNDSIADDDNRADDSNDSVQILVINGVVVIRMLHTCVAVSNDSNGSTDNDTSS